MKNIEYLEAFFKKHELSGKIKVKYSSPTLSDIYMSDITFENGDVVNINDIIFDIESQFPNEIFDAWLEYKREKDIRLIDWVQTDMKYIPKNVDRSSVEEYQQKLTTTIEDVKKSINLMFDFVKDEEGSEEE